ncbi:L-dopachrome tautomerase-related protein [Tabrizicola sp.]|uniref:SMP-30/gluconolactonase/LRE family protein n=1 Tax=Tabrizicola sp. TaxID=2005166 RepID=UPI003F326F4A
MKRFLARAALVIVGLLVLAIVGVKLMYGGGTPYPGLAIEQISPAPEVTTLVELPLPPGNVAVSADGRVFFNTHPFVQARRFTDSTVFELVDGKPIPYPDIDAQDGYQGVFGMTVDGLGRLWMVEPASLDHATTRLRAYDLATNAQVYEFEFPSGEARFAQDLRITPDGKFAILADTGLFKFTSASLIVLDLEKKVFRPLLTGDASTQPQDWVIRTANGPHRLGYGLITFSVGVDGIAISSDGQELYFATMSHDTLYKIAMRDVFDASLSAQDLSARVVAVGKKPLSDGITVDAAGRIVVTDVENGSLVLMEKDGTAKTLVKDEDVVWADGVAMMPDGRVAFTDSAIPEYIDQLVRPPELARLEAGAPYRIYAVKY